MLYVDNDNDSNKKMIMMIIIIITIIIIIIITDKRSSSQPTSRLFKETEEPACRLVKLKRNTTTSLESATSLSKRFNEENNGCARAL